MHSSVHEFVDLVVLGVLAVIRRTRSEQQLHQLQACKCNQWTVASYSCSYGQTRKIGALRRARLGDAVVVCRIILYF